MNQFFLQDFELNIKPLQMRWNTELMHFLFVYFLSADFNLGHWQPRLPSIQMEAQLSVAFCLFLSFRFSVESLLSGSHILFLNMIPHFGGEHFPIGLLVVVNGRLIFKTTDIRKNTIRLTYFLLKCNGHIIIYDGHIIIY